MAFNLDPKKGSEKFSNLLQKATEVGKSAAESAQKGAVALSERVKDERYQERLKKYNPLFPDEYAAANFVMPLVIVVADEAVRRGVDVCDGAIGWKSTEAGTEVLHLYNTSTSLKNIEFYPSLVTNGTYYVDNFNPNRYINVDCIFNKAHEERLAELKQIAYALGAKSCTIVISESTHAANSSSMGGSMGGKLNGIGKIGIKADSSLTSKNDQARSGKITAIFEGSSEPTKPTLKWFADDENIKNLIEMRCTNPGRLKFEEIKLSGSKASTMTSTAAAAIDCLKGLKGSFSMQSQAMTEHSSELLFTIEF